MSRLHCARIADVIFATVLGALGGVGLAHMLARYL